jgi:hypothetical protein
MRGLKRARSLQTVAPGQAFVHNLRRGQHEFGNDRRRNERVRITFDELAGAL